MDGVGPTVREIEAATGEDKRPRCDAARRRPYLLARPLQLDMAAALWWCLGHLFRISPKTVCAPRFWKYKDLGPLRRRSRQPYQLRRANPPACWCWKIRSCAASHAFTPITLTAGLAAILPGEIAPPAPPRPAFRDPPFYSGRAMVPTTQVDGREYDQWSYGPDFVPPRHFGRSTNPGATPRSADGGLRTWA